MANDLMTVLASEKMRDQVALCLPKHLTSERFLRVMLTQVRKVPKLAQCTQESVLACMMDLAAKGLEPDGRNAHLIPFDNRKRNITECQLIIDYKGLVELAMRSGKISRIHADVVCENDEFEYDRGEIIRHKIDFRQERGKPYAAYAIAKMKDGAESCCVMGFHEIEAVRKSSRAGNNGPWVTHWSEMAKKTAFRRLSKWLPLSPEYRDAEDDDSPDMLIRGETVNGNKGMSLQQLAASSLPPTNGNGNGHAHDEHGNGDEQMVYFPPPDELAEGEIPNDEPQVNDAERKTKALDEIKQMLRDEAGSPTEVGKAIKEVFKTRTLDAVERSWTAQQVEKGRDDLRKYIDAIPAQ